MFGDLLSGDLDHILSHTQSIWGDLRGKRVFLTGGTGFFGCWLLSSFLRANRAGGLNAEITVLSRNPEQFLRKMPGFQNCAELKFIKGDVRTFQADPSHFTHVIHAATESSTDLNGENPLEMLDSIVAGTAHVLKFARQNPVEKFLYVSSGAVYGKQPSELSHIPETYLGGPNQLTPFAAYAEGKRTAELLCSLYSALDITIARCFAFVGPFLSLDAHFAVGDFISDAIGGRPIQVKGDGSPYRSYLYGADLAIWLWKILLRGQKGEAYNVGSGSALQIFELAHLVASKVTPAAEVIVQAKRDPSAPCARYVPNVEKAFLHLGLRDFISLDQAVEKTISWHMAALHEA
jgi:nucleoside-diphosphate-sugar epimerase